MRKIVSVLVILFLTIGVGGWIYYANQFEKHVKEHVARIEESDKKWLKISEDKIEISKYLFCARIKDVRFLPEWQELKAKIDTVKVTYNPLFQNVNLDLGDNILISLEDKTIYIKDSDIVIKLDSRNFGKELFDVKLLSKNLQIYDDESDDAAFSMKNLEMLFGVTKSSLSNDNIKLYLKSDMQDLYVSNNEDRLKRDAHALFKDFSKDTRFLDYLEKQYISFTKYSRDINQDPGLPNVNCNFQLDVHEKYALTLIEILYASMVSDTKLSGIFNDEIKTDFKDTKMLMQVDMGANNAFSDAKCLVSGSKIDDKLNFKYSVKSLTNSDDITKKKMQNRTTNFLFDVINNALEYEGKQNNLTHEDLMNLSNVLININKFECACDASFNTTEKKAKVGVEFAVNNHKFSFDGDGNTDEFSAQSVLSNPKSLVNSLVNLYEEAAKPIVKKLYASDPASIKMSEMLVSNIKNNGYEALLAFHKDDTFQDGKDLVTNWEFDNKLHLKINGASFWKIATDERIVKFMQNMPDASSYEKSKAELNQNKAGDDSTDIKDNSDNTKIDDK